jgi:hypothetical protein
VAGKKRYWSDKSQPKDFQSAVEYLSLLIPRGKSKTVAQRLKKAPIIRREAKDLLRASDLQPLPPDNSDVEEHLKKARNGKMLSPVLLVRGNIAKRAPLVVADGFHRVCASYYLDEDASIPCRVVDLS